MNKIVVCEKRQLMKNGDKFTRKHFEVLRREVKISEEDMEMFNSTTDVSGIEYILNKEATAKRNELLTPKKKAGRPSKKTTEDDTQE